MRAGRRDLAGFDGQPRQAPSHQRGTGGQLLHGSLQAGVGLPGVALLQLELGLEQARACGLGGGLQCLLQQGSRRRQIALLAGRIGALTEEVRAPLAEVVFAILLERFGGLAGKLPVARTLVDAQQRHLRLVAACRAVLEHAQCRFGMVEQAGLQKVHRQRILGAIPVN